MAKQAGQKLKLLYLLDMHLVALCADIFGILCGLIVLSCFR